MGNAAVPGQKVIGMYIDCLGDYNNLSLTIEICSGPLDTNDLVHDNIK